MTEPTAEKKTENEEESATQATDKKKEADESDDGAEGTGKPDETDGGDDEKATNPKIKAVDWPLRDIKEPHANDVLYGRGGGTNHHPGNKRYRKMVEDRKLDYVSSKRLDKPLVALKIIQEWRAQDPPGRFLKMDEKTGLWQDVGDKKAREKTSQALREKAPLIRKQQEEERMMEERKTRSEDSEDEKGMDEEDEPREKKKNVKKPSLTRDHTLGQEVLEPDAAMTLDGFSWQDPFQSGESRDGPGRGQTERETSQGSFTPSMPPPPPPSYHPSARTESHGSYSGVPPSDYRYNQTTSSSSHGSVLSSDDRRRHYTASGRYESLGSGYPPPPPVPGYPYASAPAPPTPPGGWSREHSLGQNPLPNATISQAAPPGGWSREHSLSHNPLANANISQAAPMSAFENRAASGHWGPPPPPHLHHHHPYPPPPPPPPPPEGAPMYHYSSGSHYSHPPPPPPRSYGPPPPPHHSSGGPPSPPFSVDPAVASTWSGQDPSIIAKTWSSGSSGGEDYDRFRATPSPRETSQGSVTKSSTHVPRPDVVKRATSNQNETPETKPSLVGPSVKRAALNRDNSMASNRLKEQYIPGFKKKHDPAEHEHEMRQLSNNFRQSSIGVATTKPKPLSAEERTSTLDDIAMDLMVKPVSLSANSRSSTIEALALDLADDPILRPDGISRETTMDRIFNEMKDELLPPKPSALTGGDRLTTFDFLEMVNEPVPQDDSDLVPGKSEDKPSSFVDRDAGLSNWIAGV